MDISEAAFARADELMGPTSERLRIRAAFARYIQDANDACKAAKREMVPGAPLTIAVMRPIAPFILPDPVTPDAIASEVYADHKRAGATDDDIAASRTFYHDFCNRLAKRGLKIVRESDHG